MKAFGNGRSLGVLTTKFVLFENDPIIYVYYHAEDRMWGFIGKHGLEESDYRVVSLDEILEVDLTILELADLTTDRYAYRESKNSKWRRDEV